MKNDYTIIITTRDSARWLEPVLGWYRDHGLSPLFIVDTRTTDMTRELIWQHGFEFKEFLPHGNFPEAGMLEFGAQQCDSDWILRLDDDELPNESLLSWVENFGIKSKNQCWFISRRELFFENHKIFYSRSIGKYPIAARPDQLHPMARLYHRDRVKFIEEIHTTGLEDLLLYDFAAEDNFIIHFNCLVHSFAARVEKLEFYEKINPNICWGLGDEYLPEIFSLEFHQASQDSLAEFKNFFNLLPVTERLVVLTSDKKDFIINQVKKRAQALLRKNCEHRLGASKGLRHYSADDICWIEKIPRIPRRLLVNLLSLLLKKSNKNFVDTLWNYLKFYDRKVMR